MSTERAIFFFHANPVCKEYSYGSLKIFLKKKDEVFIGFVVHIAGIRIRTLQHI
jgi:hypothetical protein